MAVDYTTFQSFINTTLGESFGQGECWDYANLIWSHLGGRYYTYDPADPSGTNHGVKWGWLNANARAANTITGIVQISSINQVQAGDIVVTSGGTYGHIGFAASAYDYSGYLNLYSQNFSGNNYVTLDSNNMLTFVGAFRYTAWNPTPPPTPITTRSSTFPWVLYARKLRKRKH